MGKVMMFNMKRQRKRGAAEPVRAYNYHMNLRLTYYEAGVLRRLLAEPGVKLTHSEAAAATRVKAKVAMTEDFNQIEVHRDYRVKRLATLKARAQAQKDSKMEVDSDLEVDIDYLEQRLAGKEYEPWLIPLQESD
jgi:hypothetical protein